MATLDIIFSHPSPTPRLRLIMDAFYFCWWFNEFYRLILYSVKLYSLSFVALESLLSQLSIQLMTGQIFPKIVGKHTSLQFFVHIGGASLTSLHQLTSLTYLCFLHVRALGVARGKSTAPSCIYFFFWSLGVYTTILLILQGPRGISELFKASMDMSFIWSFLVSLFSASTVIHCLRQLQI